MEAVYDLRRGCLRQLVFDPDGRRGERHLFEQVLPDLVPGALLVLDRSYATPRLIDVVTMCRMGLVARARRGITMRRVEMLRRVRTAALTVDDELAELGSPASATGPVGVRHVRIRTVYKGAVRTLTLVTAVLDPERLPAEQLAALYGCRWTIERLLLATVLRRTSPSYLVRQAPRRQTLPQKLRNYLRACEEIADLFYRVRRGPMV